MATAKKAAPAKPAPAPVQEEAATELEVGSHVKFLGYPDDTPDEDRVLDDGAVYEVVGFTEAAGDDPGGNPILQLPNPDFNAKKKEHPDTNPRFFEVEVFPEEVEVAEAEAEAEAAPAPAPAKKTAPAKAAPAKAAPAKAAPAKAAPAKAAPAKGKGKAAEPEPPAEPEVDILDAVLENEDPEVVALVEGSEDLIATAQELDAQAAKNEYQLGGLLYHIRRDKKYLEVEDGQGYAEAGGFEKFLQEWFNIEYRKAMYLIKIYVAFQHAGIEDAAEKVAAMGWAKASKIAPLMLKGGEEAQEPESLVQLATESTAADLSAAIKDSQRVGGSPGTVVKRVTLRLRYLEEDGATVENILKTAMDQLGSKDIAAALLQIVTEWAAEHGGVPATAATKASAKPAAKAAPAKAAPPKAAARKPVAAK
jgi:hypothetical protein